MIKCKQCGSPAYVKDMTPDERGYHQIICAVNKHSYPAYLTDSERIDAKCPKCKGSQMRGIPCGKLNPAHQHPWKPCPRCQPKPYHAPKKDKSPDDLAYEQRDETRQWLIEIATAAGCRIDRIHTNSPVHEEWRMLKDSILGCMEVLVSKQDEEPAPAITPEFSALVSNVIKSGRDLISANIHHPSKVQDEFTRDVMFLQSYLLERREAKLQAASEDRLFGAMIYDQPKKKQAKPS